MIKVDEVLPLEMLIVPKTSPPSMVKGKVFRYQRQALSVPVPQSQNR